MGHAKRQFSAFYVKFLKQIRKKAITCYNLLPPNVSESHFIACFHDTFVATWSDMQREFEFWFEKNKGLERHHKKARYGMPAPKNLIKQIYRELCSRQIQKRTDYNRDRAKEELARLRAEEEGKLSNRNKKIQQNCRYRQQIQPAFASVYIDAFFRTRSIDAQFEIVFALSHFVSESIIKFFYKINEFHQSMPLKEFSMRYIQSLGLPFRLRKLKKGKKKPYAHLPVQVDSRPETLLKEFDEEKLAAMQSYDVFISHSSSNEEALIPLFQSLNRLGLVAYIDWVNDRERLPREYAGADTAKVILERMMQSESFLFVVSKESLCSPWCFWEIGCATGLKMPIFLYISSGIGIEEKLPDFLQNIPSAHTVEELAALFEKT